MCKFSDSIDRLWLGSKKGESPGSRVNICESVAVLGQMRTMRRLLSENIAKRIICEGGRWSLMNLFVFICAILDKRIGSWIIPWAPQWVVSVLPREHPDLFSGISRGRVETRIFWGPSCYLVLNALFSCVGPQVVVSSFGKERLDHNWWLLRAMLGRKQ